LTVNRVITVKILVTSKEARSIQQSIANQISTFDRSMATQDFNALIALASQNRPSHVDVTFIRVDLWEKEFDGDTRFRNYQDNADSKKYWSAVAVRVSSKKSDLFVTPGRGKKTGVWVHPLIASHYASWLNADFAVMVNETFLKVVEGDADLGADLILRDHNKDRVDRAKKRLLVCDTNKQVADLAIAHGINPGVIHNDRYRGLYRKTAKQLREDAGVKGKTTPLDLMSTRDNGFNWMANVMAVEANDPNMAFDFANGIRDLYEKKMGKPLEPIFETQSIRPSQAKSIAFGSSYQMEMAI
jgi:KilA-N domain